jgi:hypothetical protein
VPAAARERERERERERVLLGKRALLGVGPPVPSYTALRIIPERERERERERVY